MRLPRLGDRFTRLFPIYLSIVGKPVGVIPYLIAYGW